MTKLHKFIKSNHLYQRRIADALGMDASYFNKIVAGKINASVQFALKLKAVLTDMMTDVRTGKKPTISVEELFEANDVEKRK